MCKLFTPSGILYSSIMWGTFLHPRKKKGKFKNPIHLILQCGRKLFYECANDSLAIVDNYKNDNVQ